MRSYSIPSMLLLRFVGLDIFPRRDKPVHYRPFCHRGAVDTRACRDRDVGVFDEGVVYEMIYAGREGVNEF